MGCGGFGAVELWEHRRHCPGEEQHGGLMDVGFGKFLDFLCVNEMDPLKKLQLDPGRHNTWYVDAP